jgi:hypothetical protein
MNQMRSPLSDAYYSPANIEYIQGAIKSAVNSATGHEIGDQNVMDLYNLMRKVYTDYYVDDTTNVAQQVSRMNASVISSAAKTISTGIIQHLIYLRDISTQPVPPKSPVNTSTYGLKLSRY